MKRKSYKSRDYLDFLSRFPCAVTGSRTNIDLHHESLLRRFSGDRKNKFDFGAIPLRHDIHLYERHSTGKEPFWAKYHRNPVELAIYYVQRYIDEGRKDTELAEEALRMLEDVR